MHNERPPGGTGLRTCVVLAHTIVLAGCGTRSIQVTASCEEEVPPPCVCAQGVQAPICVGDDWRCPPCIVQQPDAGVPDAHPETGDPADAGGCGDGSALVCRRGCGDSVREWKPTCDGTTWRCRWGGSLEERASPNQPCSE